MNDSSTPISAAVEYMPVEVSHIHVLVVCLYYYTVLSLPTQILRVPSLLHHRFVCVCVCGRGEGVWGGDRVKV